MALKWSVTDRFHEYLYGSTFEVYTDNNPLYYVLSSAKLDATGQKWIAALQGPYNFKIHYKPGRLNQVADSLSQIDREEKIETISEIEVQAILDSGGAADVSIPFVGISEEKNPIIMKNLQIPGMVNRPKKDWQQEQMKDKGIEPVLSWKLGRRGPITSIGYSNIRGQGEKLINLSSLKGLEKELWKLVMMNLDMRGWTKPLSSCRRDFFWNNLVNETREHIRNCSRCLSFKTQEEATSLERIECSYPLEMVHLDFLSIGQPGKDLASKNKKPINVLVVTDHFTRFSHAYVTTNQTAPVIAHTLWDKFITQYGWPEKILMDQGQSCESKLFQDLCTVSNIEKIRTCPFRPQANGQVERFNKTLLNMIGTINPEEKVDWVTKIQGLIHAYNCTSNQATGYNPFFLFYGREPRVPIDIEFGLPEP